MRLAAEMQVRGNVVTCRYRGLAAIGAAILRDTCLVSATRKIDRVTSAEVEAMIELPGSCDHG